MMSNNCSGVVALVTRARFAATTAGQSIFFSAKNGYCSAHVWAKTSKFDCGVSGVGVSHTAGFRSIRRMIMSDAAYGTCTRASLGDLPGRMENVIGGVASVNAPIAPAGGVVVLARRSTMHETFVTSNVVTLSARTSNTKP